MIKFKTLKPEKLDAGAFHSAFVETAQKMAHDVHADFDTTTSDFRHKVDWEENVKTSGTGLEISVLTGDVGFYYFDQGNGGPARIIRPKKSKVLHFVSKETGEDVFTKFVHGYNGRKVVRAVESKWKTKPSSILTAQSKEL